MSAAESTSTVLATVPKNAGEEVRVALSEFRGAQLVDVRIFADMPGSAERVATRKGVCLNVSRIGALIEALQDAEAEARRRGLIGGRP